MKIFRTVLCLGMLMMAGELAGKEKNKHNQLFDVSPAALNLSPVLELPFAFDSEYIRTEKITKLTLVCADSSNTEPSSDTMTFYFNASGQMEKMIRFKRNWEQYFYKADGKTDFKIGSSGDTTRYFYDASGMLVRTERYSGKGAFRSTDFHYFRYSKGNLVCDSARFYYLRWEYDAEGRITKRLRGSSTSLGSEAEFSYDKNGKWITSPGSSELKYDASGKLSDYKYSLTSMGTTSSSVHHIQYDKSGRMQSVSCDFRGDPNDTRYRYMVFYVIY